MEEIVKKSIMQNHSHTPELHYFQESLIVLSDIDSISLLMLDFSNSYDTIFIESQLCWN